MKKLLTLACTTAALAAPAIAQASTDPATNAAKFCKQLASSSGGKHSDTYASAVRTAFPNAQNVTAKNAYGKCVSWKTKENRTETAKAAKQAKTNAAKECKAEQADATFATTHGGNTFAQQYGTGNGSNAYGKCVSQKAKAKEQAAAAQEQQEDQNTVSAAKQCKTERDADRDAFTAKYGTNHNKRNAFGKCVSKTAKAQEQEQEQQQQA
jgi:hypothetical protein